MTLKVHLLQEHDEELLENIKRDLSEGIEISCDEDLPDPPDYDILVCGVPDEKSITASPNLRHLIIPWSGLPRKTRELMLNHPDISVHNIHHNAVPVAEMAVTLMLAAAKELIPIDASFRKNDWGKRWNIRDMQLLAGRRVLIVGYGAIGREIAARCRAFGMEVSAVRRRGRDGGAGGAAGDVAVHEASQLPELLPNADVLFLSLPLTDETKGMIGEKELSLLPDGALLVNVSRGRIVDEKALYENLRASRIRAGLDVWYNYPESQESRASTPPSAYPFHELPNVIVTPHLAGHSDGTEALRARELAHVLNLTLREGTPPGRVDVELGY
jgi:phosphoglycerate dehydrogenase-like enzyme